MINCCENQIGLNFEEFPDGTLAIQCKNCERRWKANDLVIIAKHAMETERRHKELLKDARELVDASASPANQKLQDLASEFLDKWGSDEGKKVGQ